MRTTTCATLLLAGLLGAAPVAAELVMTAPAQVVAGHGATLLFSYDTTQHDLDPSTQPTATVDGLTIRVDVNAECAHISCDVLDERLFRVELPPLPAGEYAVELHADAASDQARGTFSLEVVEGELPAVAPAEGFWTQQARPGTGLHVQHRGELLAVSQFDFRDEQAHWRIDATPLHGNSALAQLRDYAGGSCFGCTPYHAPDTDELGGEFVRLTFESARQVRVERLDGTVLPLINLPFGADYASTSLQTPEQTAFDPLALPDLQGRWAIPELSQGTIRFGAPELTEAGTVLFPDTRPDVGATITIECMPQSEAQAAGCQLSVEGASAPSVESAFAALGDVEEQRVLFREADGNPVWAVRVPFGGLESALPPQPADGFWTIPGQSGTGLHLQQRGELLAMSQFDFVNGLAHWRLGVAALAGNAATVPLSSYAGGSCFGCTPHIAPEVEGDPLLASIAFDSARRALVQLADGDPIPLVNLAFGADYVATDLGGAGDAAFGPLALPDLSGTWAMSSPMDGVTPVIVIDVPERSIVELQPAVVDGDVVRFQTLATGDEQVQLLCSDGNEAAEAGCELRFGDVFLVTPPPGLYPFARLGDIEEDRIRFVFREQTADGAWRVRYWVRVPDAP